MVMVRKKYFIQIHQYFILAHMKKASILAQEWWRKLAKVKEKDTPAIVPSIQVLDHDLK